MKLNEIKVWAQMFFDDGSVSQGKRFPAECLEDLKEIRKIADDFLSDLNRQNGLLLVWGAGNLQHYYVLSNQPFLADASLITWEDIPELPI